MGAAVSSGSEATSFCLHYHGSCDNFRSVCQLCHYQIFNLKILAVNMNKINSKSSGFTLIELLVVISIVTLLSSIVFASFSSSRAQAADTRKKVEVREVGTALNLYTDTFGQAPASLKEGVVSVVESGTPQYDSAMQELVKAKVLSAVPQPPDNTRYYYYNDETIPNGEGASFFAYSSKTGDPIYTGSEAGITALNTQQGCVFPQVWNGLGCVNLVSNATSPPPPSQLPPPCGHYGDVDDDGFVTVADIDIIRRNILGITIPSERDNIRSNVDLVGNVTTVDIWYIKGYISGITNTFPICSFQQLPIISIPATNLVITGQVELDGYDLQSSFPPRATSHARTVVFIATSQDDTILKTWNSSLSNESGADFNYSLNDVPFGTIALSAETSWNMRVKLPAVFSNNQTAINFTGTNKLLGGDFNSSDSIDGQDYETLKQYYNTVNSIADINGDGVVNFDDYGIFWRNCTALGTCPLLPKKYTLFSNMDNYFSVVSGTYSFGSINDDAITQAPSPLARLDEILKMECPSPCSVSAVYYRYQNNWYRVGDFSVIDPNTPLPNHFIIRKNSGSSQTILSIPYNLKDNVKYYGSTLINGTPRPEGFESSF